MTSIRTNLSDVLFIDIETVSLSEKYDELTPALKKLWSQKAKQINRQNEIDAPLIASTYHDKAGIFAEFAKIICISVGYFHYDKSELPVFKLKSFFGQDEVALLTAFKALIDQYYYDPKTVSFCGHNIREFDIPFICRRMLINDLNIPEILNISGKKPWQVEHLRDTLEMWRFGDYKNYSALSLLAEVLGIPTSKDDIDGSQIHQVYYEDNDLGRIMHYCEKDVFCSARVYARIIGMPLSQILQIKSISTTSS